MLRMEKIRKQNVSPLYVFVSEHGVYGISIQKPSHLMRHIPLEDRLSEYTVSEPYEEKCVTK